MLGIALGLGSSVAWGISDFLGGLQTRRISALTVLLVSQPVGLVLAHWIAFRLAARITTEDARWTPTAAAEGAAQVLGGLTVALLATLPFLLLDDEAALVGSLLVLATVPALSGFVIARMQARSWLGAVLQAGGTLVVMVAVVVVKNALGH